MYSTVGIFLLYFCYIYAYGTPRPVQCHGKCVVAQDCPQARGILTKDKNDITDDEKSWLRNSYCGLEGGLYTFCCETLKNHKNLHLLPSNCGFVNGDRVYGGTKSGLFEFPWMAVLSIYLRKNERDFACGGTVINERYILTAAHCVVDKRVAGVRVGEYDLATDEDCEFGNPIVCSDPVQDFDIEKKIIHEKYSNDGKNVAHDIALLRLKRRVDLTHRNVGAVCLPTSVEEQTRVLDGVTGVIPGWGLTETARHSNFLSKAHIAIHSEQNCSLFYEGQDVPNWSRTTTKTFICAGSPGKDSCSGDSGGPLLVTGNHGGFNRYIQYGVVSFGKSKCGGATPTLYTNVVMHVPWILDHLEP